MPLRYLENLLNSKAEDIEEITKVHDNEIISIAKVHGKVEAVNEAAKDEIIDQILDTDADAEAVEEVIEDANLPFEVDVTDA